MMTLNKKICGYTTLLMMLAGCQGNFIANVRIDDNAHGALGSQGADGSPTASNAVLTNPDHIPKVNRCVQPHTPKPRGLRRLTGNEVTRTLEDVFGATDVPSGAQAFGGDSRVYAFDTIQSVLTVSRGAVVALQIYAEAVGDYAAAHLGAVSDCSSLDDTCKKKFIGQFGKKMFRRPLTDDETSSFAGLMGQGSSFADGAKAVVSAMVQSPYFLYRTELGTQDAKHSGLYLLGPYEVAAQLSYLLTGGPPDGPLLAAAEANALADSNTRMQHGQRLLATARGQQTAAKFMLQWLQVDVLDSMARTEGSLTLSSDTKGLMREEVRSALSVLLADGNSRLRDVFLSPNTSVNQDLAAFYGAQGTAAGASFGALPALALHRDVGVLGMGGVLAAASQTNIASPTLRGRMVRMRMLCGTIASPPNSVPPIASNASSDGTVRGAYQRHAADPQCAACHDRMDPLGYAMGLYDTVGRRRPSDMDNGKPVDLSGYVTEAGPQDVPLSGLGDLSTFLATSDVAGACFARHWAMYAHGAMSWPQDGCTYDDLAEAARATGYNLTQTLLAVIGLPSFVLRSSDA